MSDSLEVVRKQLENVRVLDGVCKALDPSTSYTQIFPYIAPECSKLFNAFSAACVGIYYDPDKQLVDETVEIPRNISWLGSELLKLVNNSVDRRPKSPYRLHSSLDDYSVPRSGSSDTCRTLEASFLSHFGALAGERGYRVNGTDIYLGRDDRPVLFTKNARGDKDGKTTLSLRSVTVNNLTFPAGTVFFVEQTEDAAEEKPVDDDAVPAILGMDSILTIRPLRISVFAIPREQRDEALPRGDTMRLKSTSVDRHFSNPSIRNIRGKVDRYVEQNLEDRSTSEVLAFSQ